MFRPPQAPDSWATLQIECVACKELITLAEGPEEATREQDNWHHPPVEQPSILLRYLDRVSRRETQPQNRPHTAVPTSENDVEDKNKNEPIPITCPRCGADNRNWVHILHPQNQKCLDRLINFWPIGLGLIIALAIPIIGLTRFGEKIESGKQTLLVTIILLSGLLPLLIMPRMWMSMREHRNAQGIVPGQSTISPPIRVAFILLAVFVFVLPGFIYVAVPLGFDYLSNLISPPDSPTLQQRIEQVHAQIGDALNAEKTPPNKWNTAENATVALETLLKIEPETNERWYTRIYHVLDEATQVLKTKPESELIPKIANEIAVLERFIASTQPPRVDKEFLKTWFKYVLTASLLAMLFGWWATRQYANKINLHLPRPIYYSVANMTRVVAWEAKRALEIRDYLSQIQWVDVERNELGGITLIGLFRASPNFDQQGKPVGQFLRAQRYEIMSDCWGHIEFTEIRDILSPISAVSPQYQVVAAPAEAGSDEINKTLDQLFRPRVNRLRLE
ncbi:MAG: hypothetical protein H6662_14745 [Ardenticatenaceae bacterium]|nr:hypothetical protein [Ardenticatenaceae bacterium]MCB9005422.1 hypothetical protein [Ardenticatenaceae bacterium]